MTIVIPTWLVNTMAVIGTITTVFVLFIMAAVGADMSRRKGRK